MTHPHFPRCLCAAALAAALPLIPSAARAQVDADVSYNSDSSSLSGMDALVAPIALYPDPLLGIMLPASTSPNDLQAAAEGGGGMDSNWQPAVQDLSHYPGILQWMAGNMNWTDQLGAAFASNPSDVMNAIQDLRQRALADGALQSNGQQVVVNTGGEIQILPRSTEAMYVPQYDPNAVYFGRPGLAITFGAALPCGDWLTFYPAWGEHTVWTGDFFAFSRDHGGWASAFHGGYRSFAHASGFHGNQWHVARDAQIRNMHVSLDNRSIVRPNAYGQRGQSQAYQSNAARSDRNYAQANNGRFEQTNNGRYAQANTRPGAEGRPQYAPNSQGRYAQDNAAPASHADAQRYAQSNDSRGQSYSPRSPAMSEQRYARTAAQEPARGYQTPRSAAPERPSTFAGDSRASRASAGETTARPSARTQPKVQAKSSRQGERSEKKSDKDQQQ